MAFQDYSQVGYSQAPTDRDAARREQAPHRPALYRDGMKRCLDIVLILATLPISLPLVLVMMGLAALDGHSPIYRQKRIGCGGRFFVMLMFV